MSVTTIVVLVIVAIIFFSLWGGYGSTYAIRFTPDGWTSQAGSTYTVTIGGIGEPITYEVNMVQCE